MSIDESYSGLIKITNLESLNNGRLEIISNYDNDLDWLKIYGVNFKEIIISENSYNIPYTLTIPDDIEINDYILTSEISVYDENNNLVDIIYYKTYVYLKPKLDLWNLNRTITQIGNVEITLRYVFIGLLIILGLIIMLTWMIYRR